MPTPIHAALLAAVILVLAGPAGAQTPAPDATGPQTAVPTPAPGRADTPGGSAQNGVIKPPATGSTTPVITPPATGRMPVITPPNTGRHHRTGRPTIVVPK